MSFRLAGPASKARDCECPHDCEYVLTFNNDHHMFTSYRYTIVIMHLRAASNGLVASKVHNYNDVRQIIVIR